MPVPSGPRHIGQSSGSAFLPSAAMTAPVRHATDNNANQTRNAVRIIMNILRQRQRGGTNGRKRKERGGTIPSNPETNKESSGLTSRHRPNDICFLPARG